MVERYAPYRRQVKIGGSIAQPTQQSYAAERAAVQEFGDLASRAQQVSDFAFKKAGATAKREGAQYGAQNPDQALEAYQGQAPDTVYGQAAFAAAVDVGSVQIEARAREQIANMYLEAKRNKQDPNEFSAELEAIIDGYSAPLTELDALTSAKTRLKLQNYARAAYMDRAGDAIKEHQAAVDADALVLAESTSDELVLMMTQDVANGGKVLETRLSDLRESLIKQGQTPKAVEKTVIAIRDRAHLARVRSEFDAALESGKGATYLDKFKADRKRRKGSAVGIDDTVAEVLVNSMESDIAGQVRLGKAEVKALHGDIKNQFDVLTKGGILGTSVIADLSREADRLNDPDTIARVKALEAEAKIVSLIDTPDKARAYASLLEAEAVKNSRKPAGNTEEEMDRVARASKLADNFEADAANDPLGFSYRRQGQGAPTIDYANPEALRARFAESAAAARGLGVEIKYFTKQDREQLAQILKPTYQDIEAQAAVAQSLAEAAGDNAPLVFGEIAEDRAAHVLAFIGGSRNTVLMGDFFQGRRAIAAGAGLVPDSLIEVRGTFATVVGAALSEKPDQAGALMQAASTIYAGRHQGEKDFKSDSFTEILNELVGGSGTGGGFGEINGERAILPPGMTQGSLEELIDNLTDEKIALGSEDWGVPIYAPNSGPEIVPAHQFSGFRLESYGAGLYTLSSGKDYSIRRGLWVDDESGGAASYLVDSGLPYVFAPAEFK